MSDPNNRPTPDNRPASSGISGLAFIVGGLVVAVAVLAWLFYGGDVERGAGDGGDVNISVEGGESVDGSGDSGTGAADDSAGATTDDPAGAASGD